MNPFVPIAQQTIGEMNKDSSLCQWGDCQNRAEVQTYFLGGPFGKYCLECEEKIFPTAIFGRPENRPSAKLKLEEYLRRREWVAEYRRKEKEAARLRARAETWRARP